MALSIRAADLPDGTNALATHAGAMSTKMVSGVECSVMLATRESGYHSRPHHHESEQINYVVDGEIWVFVETDGFLCRAGDFFRIPANAVHWGWNRGSEPVTTFQVHAPPLDPSRPAVAVLAAEGEEVVARGDSRNIPIDPEDADRYAAAEAAVIAWAEGRVTAAPAVP